MTRHRKNNGWLLTEIAVTLFVLASFFMVMISATATFGRFNRLLLDKQRCVAAARAQVDSVVSTGQALKAEDFKRLWPRLEVDVDIRDGAGDWKGLKLCVVTTRAKVRKRYIEIQLSQYYRPEGKL